MEQDNKQSNFGLLPERTQQEIKNLLVHDKFAQAKDLYKKCMDALKEDKCFI